MSKMNYSKYKSTNVERIPDSQVEVISAGQIETRPAVSKYEVSNDVPSGNIGQSLANAASPVAAICDCIKVGLGTIEVISKCIVAVSIEKQKTEQVKAMYKAQIVESKEQTSRVKIQEKEETKRLRISCENNLKLQKVELEKLNAELSVKEKELILSHEENMAYVGILQHAIDMISETKNQVYTILLDAEGDREIIEQQLNHLYCVDEQLVEITRHIVSMKGKN